jgi:hypothetical protein
MLRTRPPEKVQTNGPEPGFLRGLLGELRRRPEIQPVAGERTDEVRAAVLDLRAERSGVDDPVLPMRASKA